MLERTPEGAILLKPRGIGRYFTGAFLLFWLCGWAVGEGFALWILAKGVAALMSGEPFGSSREPLAIGTALAAGAFLLLWLALWTLGGFLAMRYLLQLLWGRDELSTDGARLLLRSRLGPFRSKREFPRDQIRRIVLSRRHSALAIETAQGLVELSRLGTREEREAASASLRSELGISDVALVSTADTLPKGWEEVITPDGSRAVVPDVSTRRVQARVAFVVDLAVTAVAVVVLRQSLGKSELLPIAILLVLTSMALGWGAIWLARGRSEWHIGNGRLLLRRRFGSSAKDVFEARRLELIVTSDSDGDEWFALEGVSEGGPPPPPQPYGRISTKNRRRITSVIHDPTVPRGLGAYLARAGSVPFEDRATPEVREAELKALQDQLEKSGPIGRFAVRLVAEARKRKQG